MASVKTAISLEEGLLERIDRRADELHVSRSRFLAEAAEDLLRRQESREMLARLNEVYAEPETQEEVEVRRAMLRKQRERLEGEW
jgi:metal-responsive CopG/Arc/MetJ family transcriptional regulator